MSANSAMVGSCQASTTLVAETKTTFKPTTCASTTVKKSQEDN